jgi:tetraacyldisaccharide 4'-kinase
LIKFLKIVLSPLVFVYSFGINLRNYFFNKGYFKSERVNAKVISIGNITVGGSGKTPAVIYITELLKTNGVKSGILSRGYRRKSRGYILVSDGSKQLANIDECGDEMYLASNECSVPAAVAEKRVPGAKMLIKDTEVGAIVLDDAFQHRWIERDLNLLIFDQRFLLKENSLEQKLLPLGAMRESFSAVERADAIIINRKFSDKQKLPESINEKLSGKRTFTARYEPKGFYDVKNHHFYEMEEFQGQKSLVVCGIAKPYSFLRILELNNIDFTNKILLPDHKYYNHKEVQEIRKAFYDTNSYSVLTTQKDAVKLNKFSTELDDIDIFYLKIDLVFDDKKEFDEMILNTINDNKTNN